MPRERTVYLIDGSAQVHRAYFAIRGLSTSRGLPTNAVYGFTTMLRKFLEDEKPQRLGVAFDLPGPTFRHLEYPEYKATRRKMEDDLAVQFPLVRRVCGAYRLPILEAEGFEADDVIATLARQAVEQGQKVVVVTADKDLLQLVGDEVLVLNPGREGSGATWFDAQAVEAKMGVPPERVVDLLALVGDASDNVPGVAGIGEKGARDLLREHGSLEAVLDNADKVKRAAYREGLLDHRDDALLSKRLVTLRTDAPVRLDLAALELEEPDRAACHALFAELEFAGLAREHAPEPTPARVERRTLGTREEVEAVAEAARRSGRLAVSVLRTGRDALRAPLLGLGLSTEPGRAAYLPLGHSALEVPEPLPEREALEALRPALEDPAVRKLSARAKTDSVALGRRGVGYAGVSFDAVLAGYLLNPGRRMFSVAELAQEALGERPREAGELLSGAATAASLDVASEAAGGEAEVLLRLEQPVLARLREEGLEPVFRELELPLSEILAEMERVGVKVDVALLAAMSKEMEARIEALVREVHALAGEPFNLNSPPQLREVLFERLKLRPGRKTAKTKAASTSEDVLEDLAAEHEVCRKILDYRSVQKLKGTYVDALPELVNPETGRIHASFNQTVAATGRISSSDPNLQNIPVRTPEGRRIREAFVAEEGHLLLSADYSQIELRVLAHLSKDATLVETFRRGEDVHDRTAREIFGALSPVPVDEQRRVSKMVNYALLYGKTAFTLARDLGVSRTEAQRFIDAYFARYPGVRDFLDETVAKARETGTVRTLLGRLRRLPDLASKSPQMRAEAERQAVNTPVQGSAADLIKKAMIDLRGELRGRRMASRLVLQIHDELLLEVPEAEAAAARDLVRAVMEGALPLDVPLVAEARLGRNWAEVH